MSQAVVRNDVTLSADTDLKESMVKPIPTTTVWRRKHEMPTIDDKAIKQRYLTVEEEQVLSVETARFLDTGATSISGYVRNRAFEIKQRRLRALGEHGRAQQIQPPSKNWPNTFLERHKDELQIEKPEGCGWQRGSLLLGDQVADFVASLSDAQQLCSECAKIMAKLKSLLTRARRNESRRLHVFESSLRPVDVSSCKLCCFVLTCSSNWDWPTATKYSLNVHHMENVLGPTHSESKILFSLVIKDEHSKEVHRGWIVPTLLDDAGNISDSSWSPLANTVNLAVVREWLEFCDCNHLEGCRVTIRENIPFFRLIDCNSRAIVDAPSESRFAALSYCWGPGKASQGKFSKLPNVVPLVIEDALDAARRLAIPYLWVDRYCIAQHKDSPIKPIQLQNMHKVYGSAYVTIVAGYGDRPELGLQGMSTRARKPQSSVDTHGHRLFCIPDVVKDIEDCTWSTRGWTLQENLSSRRRLVFTETQTYFQCWHMHCCEAIPTSLKRAHTEDLTRFKEFN
jgi:hypothetical protein